MEILKTFDEFVNESYIGIVSVTFKKPTNYYQMDTDLYIRINDEVYVINLRHLYDDRDIKKHEKIIDLFKKYKFDTILKLSKGVTPELYLNGYYDVYDKGTKRKTIEQISGKNTLRFSVAKYVIEKGDYEVHYDPAN